MVLDDKIISNLIFNEEYAIKVLPFTKKDYFEGIKYHIVDEIVKFFNNYSVRPTPDEIKIELQNRKGISDKDLEESLKYLSNLSYEKCEPNWLMDSTEKQYKERAIAGAIIQGAQLLEKKDPNQGKLLVLLQDALAVSFDRSIGHDYFEDFSQRYEHYHATEDKVSWGIKALDDITNGGLSKKNLACVVAPSGTGKSWFMCSIMANVLRQGKNGLYISMEMSEDRVAERIDANLFSENLNNIKTLSLQQYTERIDKLKNRGLGRLIIKEFPTSGASVTDFKALLQELRLKRDFVPDFVVVDYMNICNSSRVRAGQTNSYGFNKAISEELRGMAVEYNFACLTATQTNRNGFNNSDIDVTDISESIGTMFVMDLQFALIRNEELDNLNEIMLKQLKNRYADLSQRPAIYLGVNRPQMKIFDKDANSADNPNYFRATTTITPPSKPSSNPPPMMGRGKNDFSKFNF